MLTIGGEVTWQRDGETGEWKITPAEASEFFRTYYGPTQLAFATLSEDKQPALRRDLENVFGRYNKATDGTTSVEAEYLEVVATRA